MHLFKSFIQDLDTSLSALPANIELILLGDFNVNFTGSNLNIDKAMKRKLKGEGVKRRGTGERKRRERREACNHFLKHLMQVYQLPVYPLIGQF